MIDLLWIFMGPQISFLGEYLFILVAGVGGLVLVLGCALCWARGCISYPPVTSLRLPSIPNRSANTDCGFKNARSRLLGPPLASRVDVKTASNWEF